MIFLSVPRGTNTPSHSATFTPGNPDSATVGSRGASGERFDAEEARRLGLVHEVCPAGGLDAAAAKIVEAVLMNAPGATRATKLRTLAVARAFVDEGELRDLIEEHARTRQQAEASEGLASFREKRKPRWYPD